MKNYKAVFDGKGLLAEYENGELVYLRSDYQPAERSELKAPMIIRDIEPYKNMIDGKMITSRSQHRDLLRAHNCVEVGNETMKTTVQPTKPVDRKKILHQQLSDMSDRQANKILKQIKKSAPL